MRPHNILDLRIQSTSSRARGSMNLATCLALAVVLLSAEEAIASWGNNTGLADSSQPIDNALSQGTTTPTFDPSPVTDATSSESEKETRRQFPGGGHPPSIDPKREQMNESNRIEISTGGPSTEQDPAFRTTGRSPAAPQVQKVATPNGQHLLFFLKVRRNMTEFLRYFNSTFIRFDAPEQKKVHEMFGNGSMMRSVNKSELLSEGGGPLRLQFVIGGDSKSLPASKIKVNSSSDGSTTTAGVPIQYTDENIDVARIQQVNSVTEGSAPTLGFISDLNGPLSSTSSSTTATPTTTTTSTTTEKPAPAVISFLGLPMVPQRRLNPLPSAGLHGQRMRRSLRGFSRERREIPPAGLPLWSQIRGQADDVPSKPVVGLQEVGKVDIRGLPSKEKIYHRVPTASNDLVTDDAGEKINSTNTVLLRTKLVPATASNAPRDASLTDMVPMETKAADEPSTAFNSSDQNIDVLNSGAGLIHGTMNSARPNANSTSPKLLSSDRGIEDSAINSPPPPLNSNQSENRRMRRDASQVSPISSTPRKMSPESVTTDDPSKWDPSSCPLFVKVNDNLPSGPARDIVLKSRIDANKAAEGPCETLRKVLPNNTTEPSTTAVTAFSRSTSSSSGDNNGENSNCPGVVNISNIVKNLPNSVDKEPTRKALESQNKNALEACRAARSSVSSSIAATKSGPATA